MTLSALGDLELVKYLLQKEKGSLNFQTEPRKWTVLHLACWRGFYSIVEYLLSQGANVDLITADGLDPMGKVIKRKMME